MVKPILSTFNVQESIDFYVDVLGYTLNWKMDDDDGNPNFASISLDASEIMLGTIDFVEEEFRKNMGKGIQLYIGLPDSFSIHTVYDRVKANDVKIEKELVKRDWGEWAFVIYDPNGYNIMVAQEEKK